VRSRWDLEGASGDGRSGPYPERHGRTSIGGSKTQLLGELGALTQRDEHGVLVVVPLIHRSRVIADLSSAIPLERQAFGLDEDRPHGSQPMTVVWEGMPAPAYD
jgi:hypothetical protein